MKYSVLLVLLLAAALNAQSTFFIKYKSETPKSVIAEKVLSNKIFDTKIFKSSGSSYKVNFLAKGIAADDEILGRIIKINFPDSRHNENELKELLNDPLVEYIQEARVYKIEYNPNDSLLSNQWALSKIQAFSAWDITQGTDTVLLAIIDTGIDYLHPDLQNKIKINTAETGPDINGNDKKSNGIDDDNNGFIDDYMGWDFTDRLGFPFDSTGGDYLNWDNDPSDAYGHGTIVAGAAAAETNNFTGIAGAAPNIRILNVRAFDPSGYGEEDDAAAAILYAVQMGAKVINMSFGDNSFSYVLRDVIRYAYSRNVVLIASSGNSGTDQPHYPSGYSEVVSVGNSTENDFVSSSSNWGSSLDLVAPGTFIQTTAMKNSYTNASGTSLAAPFVSAAAALILSRENYTNDEVRQILKSTSDDINTPGWDSKSGAGRLNMLRALSVIAPSVIKFDYPKQDFATLKDTLKISATVLSAYFTRYELYIGMGITPQNWSLLKTGESQFSSSEIHNLSLTNLPDSVYTLRLVVYQSNGRTTEERVNFHISRVPPAAEIVTIGSALYGNESTVLASVYTEVPSVVKLFYKRAGSADQFHFITLDGFATNNQFVKYIHYGFIPKDLVNPGIIYEIYLEAENLTGLKTILKDSLSNFFIKTSFDSEISSEIELPFTLPFGQLYEEPVNFTSNDKSEILFNGFYPGQDLYYGVYRFNGSEFVKLDSIKNKIPRDVGDFNNNGITDILSTIQRNGFIDEQIFPDSAKFVQRMNDTSGAFWASKVEDLDGNGSKEVFVFSSDTTISVWNLNDNLTIKDSVKLQNFTKKWVGGNRFGYPRIISADFDSDGNREIWTVDNDGDIFAYEVNNGKYTPFFSFSSGLFGSAEYITSGDFNGDGKPDMAVLLKSIQNFYIAPFNYLLVFDRDNILFEEAFVDPSAEFNTNFKNAWNSLRFADLDNDGKDELITFTFPYAYIFRHTNDAVKIISYKENINSRSVFLSDFNKNGVKELAFPFPDGIRFFEFTVSQQASTPMHLEGYSMDSIRVSLNWTGKGEKYYIFRGTSKADLSLYDSTANLSFTDNSVQNRTMYYYAIRSVDNLKQYPLSNLSSVVPVYVHNTSYVKYIENRTLNTLQVVFSEKINTTVLDLQSFNLQGIGYPLSISPATEYSYLLTFTSKFDEGENHLVIKNLKDNYGSPVKEETITFTVQPVITADNFFITAHRILGPYLLKLDFNYDVDETSAADKNNYTFEPGNFIEKIEVDVQNRNSIIIHLEKRKPIGSIGVEYKLIIKDIFSSEASGKVKINSGAGSIIVLTSFEDDLSGIFVYPNPYKPGGGEQVTFAGLPKKARITILNMNGKNLRTIEENNGDGGLLYDLKDDSGESLSSGIYIYRIIRLDDSNNEVEEKLGKFAVIR
jgi:subtilisin family serine protease